MRLPKKEIFFLLIPCLLLFFYSFAYSQESTPAAGFQPPTFDYAKAYQDYIYNLSLYHQAYQKFVIAKNEYLTYQTLTSETKALEATKNMLEKRSQAAITYLSALRMRLAETTGILTYKSNLLFLNLLKNIEIYEGQKTFFPSAATLNDLLKVSIKFEEQYKKTEILIFDTLLTIIMGKENNLRDQIQYQITKIQEKLTQIKKEDEKDTAKAERWLLEAKNKILLSKQKQEEAEEIISKLIPSKKDKIKDFREAQLKAEESNQYLKESVSNLKELILEVKSE